MKQRALPIADARQCAGGSEIPRFFFFIFAQLVFVFELAEKFRRVLHPIDAEIHVRQITVI